MSIGNDLNLYVNSITEKYNDEFKVVHINAQSLHNDNHFIEFTELFENSGIDLVCVSETFFKTTSYMKVDNYNVFNVNRSSKGGGGCVPVYVGAWMNVKVLEVSDGGEGKPEFILLEVHTNFEKILVGCVYKPPHVGHMDIVLDALCPHLLNYKYAILCGDVNARFGSKSAEKGIIEEFIFSCNLECIPFGPTFHIDNCDSCLDIIASNCHDLVSDFGQTPSPGFSHHDLLYSGFNIQSPCKETKTITYRSFKHFSQENFEADIESINWNEVYCCTDVDEKVRIFNEKTL